MGVIIIGPRRVVRRGMKRIIEDLETYVSNPQVHAIMEKSINEWTETEESIVQSEIDRLKTIE